MVLSLSLADVAVEQVGILPAANSVCGVGRASRPVFPVTEKGCSARVSFMAMLVSKLDDKFVFRLAVSQLFGKPGA